MPDDNALSQQRLENLPAVPPAIHVHKVGFTRNRRESQRAQTFHELFHPGYVHRAALRDMLVVAQSGKRRALGNTVGIERRPDTIQEIRNFRRRDSVPDAQARQTRDF